MNTFDLQFFELATVLKQPLTEQSILSIRKILLKLNNPTYYSRYVTTHPASSFGFYKNRNINPVLLAISNMLNIIKNSESYNKKLIELQKEYSWAFNNYIWYTNLVKNTK